jgi:hypothetical protein
VDHLHHLLAAAGPPLHGQHGVAGGKAIVAGSLKGRRKTWES